MRKTKQPIVQRTIGKKLITMNLPNQPMPTYAKSDTRMKIAIIQTGSWGDNINSTLMLRPIKKKFGSSVIDVYTSTLYGSAFHNNSYINNLIEYRADTKNDALHLTLTIPEQLVGRNYDLILSSHPMFNHGNWNSINHPELGDNLIYAWVRALEHNNIPYDMPLETILELTRKEIENVLEYMYNIRPATRNILMEVSGESGQTFWNPNWTIEVSKYLLDGNTNLFISRKNDSDDIQELERWAPNNVFFVGHLTIRECAELFNHCQVFFSVSSGLSNACNTNWCKKDIKWFETVNSPAVTSAPVRSSGKVFWYKDDIGAFISMLKDNQI